ncbi:amine oxidase [Fusarium albosuccineum]|uniref:Amine oxidase n=1 Tax=Fusarium albosuccineum TaxID=1237068 RepID=A0A8H4KSE9_9HYPO|nr:amine oxidase [Fusarium albosuccineum]
MDLFKFVLFALVVATAAINVDVAVVGGGASGAYAAVRLREDFGKEIVVIEKQNRLGGHTQTWYDPATREAFNYGVEAFTNLTTSADFFARLNVPVKAAGVDQPETLFADFRDGKPVNYTPPIAEEVADAIVRYTDQWLKYGDLMLPTSSGFPDADDIPPDLLLTWDEFVRKYNLGAVSPRIWKTVVIDLNTALMIDVWKAYYPPLGAIQPASGDNAEIWHKAAQVLGDAVMYESEVVSTRRSKDGVRLEVKGKAGDVTEINAKRLLVTIGPETMDPNVFDLDDQELSVFASSTGNRYYTGIVSHPSLPVAGITNVVPGLKAPNYLTYPAVPFQADFRYKGNSSEGPIYRTLAVVPTETELEDAKSLVRSSLENLMNAGTIPAGNITHLNFMTFDDHGIMYRRWSADKLRDGIVSQANALQGLRSTWYTGAFWMNNNAAMLWNTTNAILPRMLKGT